jgi:hypothetical protein
MLAQVLLGKGIRSVALDLDGVFHQGTAQFLGGVETRQSGLSSVRPFYRASAVSQARIVAAARPLVETWLDGVTAVVAFNDGALQRLVLAEALDRDVPTDMVLDGMISFPEDGLSARALVRRALRSAGRALGGASASAFLPSDVGMFPVRRIHVAGHHSANVLRERGSRANEILASGLPRWPEPEPSRLAPIRNVLYLTGAFRWHGDPATAVAQEQDVVELAAVCRDLGLPLAVRVHPRDERHRYEASGVSLVDPRAETITETIRRSDLVLSVVSTGLVEGVILGKPSRVLAIHPDWRRFSNSFAADPVFRPLRHSDALRDALTRMASECDEGLLEQQRARLSVYVAATGRAAAGRIASCIGSP